MFSKEASIILKSKQLSGLTLWQLHFQFIYLACSRNKILSQSSSPVFAFTIQLYGRFVEKKVDVDVHFLQYWKANNVVLAQAHCPSHRDVQCPHQSNWL